MKFYSIVKKKFNKNLNKTIFIDHKRKLTCKEILEETDRYSNLLKPHLNSNQISIPIVISRRSELLIAFLACLKLDISFTPFMKISDNQTLSILEKVNSNFYFDPVIKKITNFKTIKNRFKKSQKIKNKIYILFTSGSTGKPKGVICDKENIMNTLLWSQKYIKWKKNDVIGNVTKFNFDISLFDFFSSIYFLTPITIIKNTNDIDEIIKKIKINKVTSFFSTPSFFSQFVYSNTVKKTKNTSLKQIISGGDFFPKNHLINWYKNNNKIKIYNVWGPTETSIVNSMYLLKNNDKKNIDKFDYLPVGISTKRMNIKIIKRKKIIKNKYEKGFICLSGKSISKGFIDENYRYKKMLIKINNKIYFNTGDIGYFDNNNLLFISGRLDNDIKIQGYRINQKEIERISESYENIFLSASFKKNISTDFSELHLIIQLENKSSFDIFKFKNYLRKKLLFYKIPKKIIILKKIPLNSNGKIDRIKINKIYS